MQKPNNNPRTSLPSETSTTPNSELILIQVRVPSDIKSYFDSLELPRGSMQNLLLALLRRFYNACTDAGIPPIWEPDTIKRLNEILERGNYDA